MIRRYQQGDYKLVRSWFLKRGLDFELQKVPQLGFIYLDAAAGFLYKTDSQIVLLDNFVTNKDAPIKERSEGIKKIIGHLLEIARFKRYFVYGITQSRGMSKIVKDFGFKSNGWFEVLHKGV